MTLNVESFNIQLALEKMLCQFYWSRKYKIQYWTCSTEEQITTVKLFSDGFQGEKFTQDIPSAHDERTEKKTVTEQERKAVTLTVRTEQKEERLN